MYKVNISKFLIPTILTREAIVIDVILLFY